MKDLLQAISLIAFIVCSTLSILGVKEVSDVLSPPEFEIYTTQDIIYVKGHHVTSEMGIDTIVGDVSGYISYITGKQSTISDLELYSLVQDYSYISSCTESVSINFLNPYTNNEMEIQYNTVDDYPDCCPDCLIYYFEN